MDKIICALLLICLYSCYQNQEKSRVNDFDISPDIGNIAFSYKKDSLYNIYILNHLIKNYHQLFIRDLEII